MGKIFTVKMPDIGEGVVEGEVISWLKSVGDELGQDEPVVIVMTDKATVELPSPYPGRLAKQYYQVGEIAIKDEPLYDITIEVELKEKKVLEPPPLEKTAEKKPLSSSTKIAGKALAAPFVRKLAHDLGVDINAIEGSGKEGHVTKEDVKKYSHAPLKPKEELLHLPGDKSEPLVGIRNLMAEKMAESATKIPHFSYFEKGDATRLEAFREKMRPKALERDIRLTFMPFFIKALSLCLHEHPLANSTLDVATHSIITHQIHNVGIAMNTSLGLIVPVLKNVQTLSLFEIIYAYEGLKEKAKAGKLRANDLKEATITITNFGALSGGGTFATPIINYPEVAILGVARIQKESVVIHEELAIRSILNCSWSFDHRVIDGNEAAHIAQAFLKYIANPSRLL